MFRMVTNHWPKISTPYFLGPLQDLHLISYIIRLCFTRPLSGVQSMGTRQHIHLRRVSSKKNLVLIVSFLNALFGLIGYCRTPNKLSFSQEKRNRQLVSLTHFSFERWKENLLFITCCKIYQTQSSGNWVTISEFPNVQKNTTKEKKEVKSNIFGEGISINSIYSVEKKEVSLGVRVTRENHRAFPTWA